MAKKNWYSFEVTGTPRPNCTAVRIFQILAENATEARKEARKKYMDANKYAVIDKVVNKTKKK